MLEVDLNLGQHVKAKNRKKFFARKGLESTIRIVEKSVD